MTTNTQKSLAVTGGLSDEQTELIKRTICKGATDDELLLFLNVVKRTGLDPFSRQIHAVKRWDSKENREVMSIQTGIDGLRLIASRTGEYGGSDDAVYEPDDGEHPNKATVTVYRIVGGKRVPLATKTARWSEYAQYKKNGDLSPLWKRMPFLMLGKCAEALALRAAFPAEMSGVYVEEELPRSVHPALDGEDSTPKIAAVAEVDVLELLEGMRQADSVEGLRSIGQHVHALQGQGRLAPEQVDKLRAGYQAALAGLGE